MDAPEFDAHLCLRVVQRLLRIEAFLREVLGALHDALLVLERGNGSAILGLQLRRFDFCNELAAVDPVSGIHGDPGQIAANLGIQSRGFVGGSLANQRNLAYGGALG